MIKHLLIQDSESATEQSKTTKVQLGEQISLLGLHMGIHRGLNGHQKPTPIWVIIHESWNPVALLVGSMTGLRHSSPQQSLQFI